RPARVSLSLAREAGLAESAFRPANDPVSVPDKPGRARQRLHRVGLARIARLGLVLCPGARAWCMTRSWRGPRLLGLVGAAAAAEVVQLRAGSRLEFERRSESKWASGQQHDVSTDVQTVVQTGERQWRVRLERTLQGKTTTTEYNDYPVDPAPPLRHGNTE